MHQPTNFSPSCDLERDVLMRSLLTGLFSTEGKWVYQPPNFSPSWVLERGALRSLFPEMYCTQGKWVHQSPNFSLSCDLERDVLRRSLLTGLFSTEENGCINSQTFLPLVI